LAPRAPGESVRPCRLAGVGARPLNFTVRHHGVTTMRFLLLVFAVLSAQIVRADPPQFDRDLALAAGRAYAESYLRWNPVGSSPKLDSTKATVEFVPYEDGDFRGWVGVFVPDSSSDGCGFAVFHVGKLHPGYMFLGAWGYWGHLSDTIARFRKEAASGHVPLVGP
jgi:hypothetical protein